jgi:hypothetical protein
MRSDKMNDGSDATVMIKDDAKRNAYSQSGDGRKVKRSKLGKDTRICNTVRTEDEICGSNRHFRHFRHATNTKMLFL